MNSNTRKRLEATGARVTTVQDFLGLSEAEMAVIEIKIALAKELRKHRQSAELTQHQAAKLFGSSQSRVAKMEAGDPTVSMDLLVCSLLKLGASTIAVGRAIERAETTTPLRPSGATSLPAAVTSRPTAIAAGRARRRRRSPANKGTSR